MSDVFTPCALIGLLWFSAKAQEKMKYALKLQFHLGTLRFPSVRNDWLLWFFLFLQED